MYLYFVHSKLIGNTISPLLIWYYFLSVIVVTTSVREVPVDHDLCSTQSIWCTTSIEEKDKCEVVRAGGITTGVYPTIECRSPASSIVTCLDHVNKGRADFVGVDSNYGFIARQWVIFCMTFGHVAGIWCLPRHCWCLIVLSRDISQFSLFFFFLLCGV